MEDGTEMKNLSELCEEIAERHWEGLPYKEGFNKQAFIAIFRLGFAEGSDHSLQAYNAYVEALTAPKNKDELN